MNRPPKLLATLMAALLILQGLPSVTIADTTTPTAAAAPAFRAEEIEQLVAPIALYPDPLLAQVLMASTYPLEVVTAARWQKENSSLKDKALEDALQQQPWDPSVKSLTAFPPVLTMLNDKLDWTQKLGDAFLAQQDDVMQAVQRLRAKAEAAGNLESNDQQKVIVEQAPANVQQNVTVEAQAAPAPTIIKIEPAQPQVVYVPTYNPTVVYGAWPYPTYPPYSYYPPGYVAATSVISFGVGMAVGAALWGGCSWGGYNHSDVNINVNQYNNFNRTNVSNDNWQHNVEHRKGVQYRDQATQQKYKPGSTGTAQSREAFRGRADQGRQELDRGAAKDFQPKPATGMDRGGRPGGEAGDRGSRQAGAAGDRGARPPGPSGDRAARQGDRPQPMPGARPSAPTRSASNSPGAFQGMGNGQQARVDASRGRASRQSAAATRGGGGGGARGGGGGARGGGGGAHGGGGGGGRRR
jgi:hypothetical protein